MLETKSQKGGSSKIEIKRNSQGKKIEGEISSARPVILGGNSGTGLAEIYKNLKKSIGKTVLNNLEIYIINTLVINKNQIHK